MRVAGIREFRNRAAEMLKSRDIVFVTRHGKLSGLLVPLANPEDLPVELRRDLLERLGRAISLHLEERGVSEKNTQRDFEAWKSRRGKRRGRR
jgi:antitoxin (DNA-binding transcriptional repressor) of toxin-antitoxin stability system